MRQAHHFYANTMAQQQPQRTLDRQQQQGSVNEYQSRQPGERQMGEGHETACDHDQHAAQSRSGLRGE